jgi:predicted dehydrogenase
MSKPSNSNSSHPKASISAPASRRDFLYRTSALVAGSTVLGTAAQVARGANVVGSEEIKVAVIGCGGRGSGAVEQALETAGPVTLWAAADAFADNLQRCLTKAQNHVAKGQRDGNPLLADSKVNCPSERQFVGFNAYQQAIDSGADLIILATPPGFRPIHFEAAVEAGKDIFMEKPVAVDAPGVRRVLKANEVAKQKQLMVAVGLQRRHDPSYVETIARLQDGAIGDINLTRVYWNGAGVWIRNRQPDQTEMEYQMRNWYYFNWLCGDHITEQHIHNLDVSNWLLGMLPEKANGMGGREVRKGNDTGQIFDHHFVEFTYPNGAKMFSQCRHIPGCWSSVSEWAHGSQGTANISGQIEGAEGKWRYRGRPLNAHHQEHHDLFAALRKGEVYNEGDYGAHSTMTSILGRMATYSGQEITWEQAINSELDLSPAKYDFAADPPVMPGQDGFYPVPVPGVTRTV